MCDKRASVRMKGKLVRPAMVQRQEAELEVAEMMIDGIRDEGQHAGCFGDKAVKEDMQLDVKVKRMQRRGEMESGFAVLLRESESRRKLTKSCVLYTCILQNTTQTFKTV